MSLHASSRRLVRSAASLTHTPLPLVAFLAPACIQRRTISLFGFGKKNREPPKTSIPVDPITEKFLKTKPSMQQQQQPQEGGLSSSSIFQDEKIAGPEMKESKDGPVLRYKHTMAAALDPHPKSRERFERKMVIRDIRKRGRLTRKQLLKQQERELLAKSHDIPTSTKKLVHIARQIAGKTVEDAIVQMRFSAKKAAKEVKYHIEHARNQAIVRRGMGLGKVNGATGPAVQIQTKDGKRLKIEDKTRLYIDQAWVNKGLYGTTMDFRARGRVHRMKNPTTSITLVLKEEATRIRLHEERVQKDERRRVWTQLPNRPITAQRQYYSW